MIELRYIVGLFVLSLTIMSCESVALVGSTSNGTNPDNPTLTPDPTPENIFKPLTKNILRLIGDPVKLTESDKIISAVSTYNNHGIYTISKSTPVYVLYNEVDSQVIANATCWVKPFLDNTKKDNVYWARLGGTKENIEGDPSLEDYDNTFILVNRGKTIILGHIGNDQYVSFDPKTKFLTGYKLFRRNFLPSEYINFSWIIPGEAGKTYILSYTPL